MQSSLKHFTTPEFWEYFKRLDANIQEIAKQKFELLKTNPKHPSLYFKKIKDYSSVRINKSVRALGTFKDEHDILFWIGTHDDYETLIKD